MNIFTNIEQLIKNISYKFTLQGDVIPILELISPFKLIKDNKVIITTELALTKQIDLPESILNMIFTKYCPCCGAPLFVSYISYFGRCINKGCCGQLFRNLFHFLQAIHLELPFNQRRIVDTLVQTGGLLNIASLWYLTYPAFQRYDFEESDIINLLLSLQHIRSKISLSDILYGLDIFSLEDSKKIENRINNSDIQPEQITLYHLLDKNDLHMFDYEEFISLESNLRLFEELMSILK